MRTFRYILSLLSATLALLAQTVIAQDMNTKAAPSEPTFPYILTIQQPAEGAKLTAKTKDANAIASGESVHSGSPIYLYFAPEKGYQLVEGSILYNGIATKEETLSPTEAVYTARRSFLMPAQPTTVTAQAELIRYTIAYNANGGTLPQGNPSEYTMHTDDITLLPPTTANTYLTFGGWKDTAGNTVTNIKKGSTGNLALTAQWTERKLTKVEGKPDASHIIYTSTLTAQQIADSLATFWPRLTLTTDKGEVIDSKLSWKLKDGALLDLFPGKKNDFIWTAAPRPAGVNDNGQQLTGTTQVYIPLDPITPPNGSEITIKGDSTYQDDKEQGADKPFNGEIIGEESDTIKTINLAPPTEMDITLNGVNADMVKSASGQSTLILNGNININNLTINPGSELVLTTATDNQLEMIKINEVINGGFFKDNTTLISQVTIPLSDGSERTLIRKDPELKYYINSTKVYTELEAGVTANEDSGMSLEYQWQMVNEKKKWVNAPDDSHLRNASNTYRTKTEGQYRCQITATVKDGRNNITTVFITTPTAVENSSTGIEQVQNATLIRAESGALLISTPVSVKAQLIALTGNVIRTVQLPAGDSRLDGLASGIYIVRLSSEITKKVIIQ